MVAQLNRWNDDRLDDLAANVRTNTKTLGAVEDIVQAHDRDLKQMAKTGDRRTDHQWAIRLALFVVVLTGIANLIVALTIAAAHP